MSELTLQAFRRIPRKIANRLTVLLFVLLFPLERILYRYSLVERSQFMDSEAFPWVPILEENWSEIRRELDQVLRYETCIPGYLDLSDDAEGLTERQNWKSFFFYAYGVRVPANCEICPLTASLLKRIDGMKSGFFSILQPGTRLKPHRGHYAGVLRYHLGLIVPDVERCGLRVGNETRRWEEGKSLLFDDTFEHEAWNESGGLRVVLFVDFARPLPFPLSALNHLMIWLVAQSSVVQPGIARLKDWNRRFAVAWRDGTSGEV